MFSFIQHPPAAGWPCGSATMNYAAIQMNIRNCMTIKGGTTSLAGVDT